MNEEETEADAPNEGDQETEQEDTGAAEETAREEEKPQPSKRGVKAQKKAAAKPTKKGAKKTVKQVIKQTRDQSWRPIMFSRNTAMFTIPTEVRDKANLIDLHNAGAGAKVTFDEKTGNIIIRPGVKRDAAA